MFIKRGDGQIVQVIETDSLTEEQKQKIQKEVKKAVKNIKNEQAVEVDHSGDN